MKTSTLMWIMVGFAAFLPAVGLADAYSDAKARCEQRNPKLLELRKAGTVGETASGYVEAVPGQKADKTAAELLAAENADRAIIYKTIAAKTGKPADEVARDNGNRIYNKVVEVGEMYKFEDGKWKKKT